MDDYEKRIREKLYNSGLLTSGEWVYLVGVFQAARDLDEIVNGAELCGVCGRALHNSLPTAVLHGDGK